MVVKLIWGTGEVERSLCTKNIPAQSHVFTANPRNLSCNWTKDFVVEREQLFTWAMACPLCNDLDGIFCKHAHARARAHTHTHTHTQPRSKLILIPLYTLQLNVIMHLDDLTQKNAKEQNIISEYMHSLVVLALLRTVASRSPSYN